MVMTVSCDWQKLHEITRNFLEKYRGTHYYSPPWTAFREYWRPAVIAACDLILVEVNDKCQFVVDTSLPTVSGIHSWNQEIFASTLVLKMCLLDQQHQHHWGYFVKMQILRPQLTPTELEILAVGPRDLNFKKKKNYYLFDCAGS